MNNYGNKIFDRSNYSKRTNDIFELLAAYFIDIYYNHLYIEAKKLFSDNKNKVSSITAGYEKSLSNFLKGMDNPKLYKKYLSNINTYFMNVGFGSITFIQTMDKITREFVPEDYFGSLSNTQKISILRTMLKEANKKLIMKIVNIHLHNIIDNHDDADNVRVMQDDFIDILIVERDVIYKKFLYKKATTHKNSAHINLNMLESMEKEIKILYKEKFDLQKKIIAMKKIIIEKHKTEEKLTAVAQTLTKENDQLTQTINELKNEFSAPARPMYKQPIAENSYRENVHRESTRNEIARGESARMDNLYSESTRSESANVKSTHGENTHEDSAWMETISNEIATSKEIAPEEESVLEEKINNAEFNFGDYDDFDMFGDDGESVGDGKDLYK